MDDPLTLTYAYLWKLVEGFPEWSDMVRVGNRMYLDGTSRDPMKDVVKAADLPMVTLMPTDSENNLHSNSSSAILTQNFTIGIYSGEQRVNTVYFPLKWYTVQALAQFRATMQSVTWNDYPFIQKLEVPSSTDSLSEIDTAGNIISWDSLLTISVEMRFPNQLFLLEP